jgi:hypothetical protein
MICPNCGFDCSTEFYAELGRKGKGKTSPKKTEASRRNFAKAREHRWPKPEALITDEEKTAILEWKEGE